MQLLKQMEEPDLLDAAEAALAELKPEYRMPIKQESRRAVAIPIKMEEEDFTPLTLKAEDII